VYTYIHIYSYTHTHISIMNPYMYTHIHKDVYTCTSIYTYRYCNANVREMHHHQHDNYVKKKTDANRKKREICEENCTKEIYVLRETHKRDLLTHFSALTSLSARQICRNEKYANRKRHTKVIYVNWKRHTKIISLFCRIQSLS